MNLKVMYLALTGTISVPSSMCVMYICCKKHTPHDALVGGRAQNNPFPSDATTCSAACSIIIVSKMDGSSPHSDNVQPSDTTVNAPEFDLFLALLIVTEAELLDQFPSPLRSRGQNTGLISLPALRQQRRTTGSFSFPPDNNGERFSGTVSFPSDGNGGRTTGSVSFPSDGNRDELLVQFPSHLTQQFQNCSTDSFSSGSSSTGITALPLHRLCFRLLLTEP